MEIIGEGIKGFWRVLKSLGEWKRNGELYILVNKDEWVGKGCMWLIIWCVWCIMMTKNKTKTNSDDANHTVNHHP